MLVNILQYTEQAPAQITLQPQMSLVRRLKSPDLKHQTLS